MLVVVRGKMCIFVRFEPNLSRFFMHGSYMVKYLKYRQNTNKTLECIRELDTKATTETIKLPLTPIMEDDVFKSITPYIDNNLNKCLELTPNHMPGPKKPIIELKELPKNLRYEFLDEELNRPIIVNANLGRDKTTQLLMSYENTLKL